jgi:hypothetical protein
VLIPVAVAAAQVPPTDVEAELWRTAADARRTVWTDDAARPDEGLATVGATTFYAHRPLVYTPAGGDPVAVVGGAVRTDVVGTLAWERFRGALILPVAWTAASDTSDGGGSGLGDVSLDGKVVLLDATDRLPVALAGTARVQVPTATFDLPLGSPGTVGELAVAASGDLGSVGWAANVGPRLGPRSELGDVVIDDAVAWRLAAIVPVRSASLALEGMGRLGFGSPFAAASPAELLVSGQGPLPSGFTVRGGLAAGLGGAVGVPAFRVVAGVGWSAPLAAPTRAPELAVETVDRDLDGLVADDACVSEPEDRDGTADEDGCPDPDDDADGVVDGLDACPGELEDLDGWKDDDGCPDPKTRVGVRVASASGEVWASVPVNVVCGTLARTISADQALDVDPGSCTFGGGGADGIPAFTTTVDVPAGAPLEVPIPLELPGPAGVVRVEVTAEGGGPVEQAACTFDAGRPLRVSGAARVKLPPGDHAVKVFAQGYEDHVGRLAVTSGGEATLAVALTPTPAWLGKGRIHLARPLGFVPGTSIPDGEAGPALQAIAALLAEHPEVGTLRVEVHTGPDGAPDANQLLSDERAIVLRDALVASGVPSERITMTGLGESRPIPEGSERVELRVEQVP